MSNKSKNNQKIKVWYIEIKCNDYSLIEKCMDYYGLHSTQILQDGYFADDGYTVPFSVHVSKKCLQKTLGKLVPIINKGMKHKTPVSINLVTFKMDREEFEARPELSI